MNYKIISDGTISGTKVINSDTGELIGGIQKIIWECTATNDPRVTIETISGSNAFVNIDTILDRSAGIDIELKDMVLVSKNVLNLV